MSQRTLFAPPRPSTPVNDQSAQVDQLEAVPVRVQPAEPEDELLTLYKRSSDVRRKLLLTIMTDAHKHQLYQFYLNDLDADIQRLEAVQHPASSFARSLHTKLKDARNERFRLADSIFFDVLHKTNDLLKTPVLNADLTFNADFEQRATAFTQSMTAITQDSRAKFSVGLAYAIGAGLLLAGIIVVNVLTFGQFGFGIDPSMAVLTTGSFSFTAGLQTLMSIPHFAYAKKEKLLVDKMEPLVTELREEYSRPKL